MLCTYSDCIRALSPVGSAAKDHRRAIGYEVSIAFVSRRAGLVGWYGTCQPERIVSARMYRDVQQPMLHVCLDSGWSILYRVQPRAFSTPLTMRARDEAGGNLDNPRMREATRESMRSTPAKPCRALSTSHGGNDWRCGVWCAP